MIDSIRLENFKCFRTESIDFGGLTVLSGVNGTGKSSVIQAVLALRQGLESRHRSPWRGSLVDLGSFNDVLHSDALEDKLEIEASFTDRTGEARLTDSLSRGESGYTQRAEIEASRAAEEWCRGDLFYLSADRLGPRPTLPYLEEGHPSATPLGTRGEHVLWFLEKFGRLPVGSGLRRSVEPNNSLAAQTSAWLSLISPGAELVIQVIPEADSAVASYRFAKPDDVYSSAFRAANVGFGVSYGLPPIVALLAPRRGGRSAESLVIIENPEAHLHPAGQTSLAELASRAAADGTQVILETHSDHVLNGVRLAVRQGILPPDDVAIHFFERQGLSVRVTTPVVSADGQLDMWPAGFFDEYERNLSKLIGVPSSASEQRNRP